MYQQVNLADDTLVGSPGDLPPNLVGLSDAVLADLSAAIQPPPPGLAGQGFWPVVVTTPSYDATSQVVVSPASYAADSSTGTVTGTATVRAMTDDEYAAANPAPASVSNYQARRVLIGASLFAKVGGAIRGADQTVHANQVALQAWDYANDFFRTDPIIGSIQTPLGLTDAQIDALFRQAALIR